MGHRAFLRVRRYPVVGAVALRPRSVLLVEIQKLRSVACAGARAVLGRITIAAAQEPTVANLQAQVEQLRAKLVAAEAQSARQAAAL
eukprot:1209244-Prymnesium_polylepis.1